MPPPKDTAKALAERFEKFMTAPPPKAPVIPLAAAKGPVASPEQLADRLAELVATGVGTAVRVELPDRDTAQAVADVLRARGDQRLIDIWTRAMLQDDAARATAQLRATLGDERFNELLKKAEREGRLAEFLAGFK